MPNPRNSRRRGINQPLSWATVHSELGELLLIHSAEGLCRIAFSDEDFAQVVHQEADARGAVSLRDEGTLAPAAQQLAEYFEGRRTSFDLKLDLPGNGFRQRAQRALSNIEYGQTATYGEVAEMLGSPRAARAVGTACATNPLPIVLPCHRVTTSTGAIGGYSGGRWRKERLLALERAVRGR